MMVSEMSVESGPALFADDLARLGGIAPQRLRPVPVPGNATLADCISATNLNHARCAN